MTTRISRHRRAGDAALRQLDRRRPRRQSQCHGRNHPRGHPDPAHHHSEGLYRTGGQAGRHPDPVAGLLHTLARLPGQPARGRRVPPGSSTRIGRHVFPRSPIDASSTSSACACARRSSVPRPGWKEGRGSGDLGYAREDDFIHDLQLIRDSLISHGDGDAANAELLDLIRLTRHLRFLPGAPGYPPGIDRAYRSGDRTVLATWASSPTMPGWTNTTTATAWRADREPASARRTAPLSAP